MRLIKIIFLTIAFCLSFNSLVIGQQSTEYYQSLYLLKFIKYSYWTKPQSHFSIGVVGNSPVIPYLKAMTQNKMINGKKVTLSKISSYSDIDKYSLIYIPKSQNSKFNTIISKTKTNSTLIVCEDNKFIRKGACISFYEKQNALKFSINTSAVSRKSIKISKRLLSVAYVIDKKKLR